MWWMIWISIYKHFLFLTDWSEKHLGTIIIIRALGASHCWDILADCVWGMPEIYIAVHHCLSQIYVYKLCKF